MKIKLLSLLAVTASLIFSSCSSEPKSEASAEPAVAAVPDEPHDIELVVSGMDNMMFDINKLEAVEGQRVKLVFKNIGNIPKSAMGHNWVLLAPGTDIAEFAVDAATYMTDNYVPTREPNASLVLASTKILGPKEEAVVYFTAGAPGEYPYVCTFPGHAAIMQGVLTVKPAGPESGAVSAN
ncbi:MAG: plastocyanin/azurin family copper-binding protein [Opitutales bacterium]